MARRDPIHYPGAIHHVRLRGNGGKDVAFEEPYRFRLYDLLKERVQRSIVCAAVPNRIPVWRRNIRWEEKTRHK